MPAGSNAVTAIVFTCATLSAVGIGGSYATGTVITTEYAPRRYRGTLVALSFSMQFIGYIFAACSTLLIVWGLRPSLKKVCLITPPC